MIIDDFVQIKLKEHNQVIVENVEEILEGIKPFLLALSQTINTLSEEEVLRIKKSKGAGGPTDSFNVLRLALNRNYSTYTYPELVQFIEEYNTDYNPEASDLLNRLLQLLREKVEEHYPDENEWLRNYVPENLRNELVSKKAIASLEDPTSKVWDFLSYANISALASYKTNWSQFYKGILKIEGAEAKGEAIAWLKVMESSFSDVTNNRKITSAQFQQIARVAAEFGIE